MRMSLDMTDMIVAFTTKREITGHIENDLSPRANKCFITYIHIVAGVVLQQKINSAEGFLENSND